MLLTYNRRIPCSSRNAIAISSLRHSRNSLGGRTARHDLVRRRPAGRRQFSGLSELSIPPAILQYGASEGDTGLRQHIAAELRDIGLDCRADQVLILSGSSRASIWWRSCSSMPARSSPSSRDLSRRSASLPLFRCPDSHLAAAAPAWPTWCRLSRILRSLSQRQRASSPGQSLRRCRTPLFEDDPTGNWSTTLATDLLFVPGCVMRPGSIRVRSPRFWPPACVWLSGGIADLMPHLVRLKQAADLHSSRISQWLVANYLDASDRQARLERLRRLYRDKRDRFAESLARHFADFAEWQLPPGGLSSGCSSNGRSTPAAACRRARRWRRFHAGENFFAEPERNPGYLRLNFSLAAADESSALAKWRHWSGAHRAIECRLKACSWTLNTIPSRRGAAQNAQQPRGRSS